MPAASRASAIGALSRQLVLDEPRHLRYERRRRAVGRFVNDGMLDRHVLDRTPPAQKDDRLLEIIAGIRSSAPDVTLKEIAARLEAMCEPTPRGPSRLATSSVAHLLDRARQTWLVE